MPETLNHPAVAVLQSFFAEMRDWDVEGYREQEAIDWATTTQEKVDAINLKARQALEAIFEKYCDVGTRAKRLKGGLVYSKPTAYDPEREAITSVEVKRGKAIIETQQPFVTLVKKKRYELVERDEQWKIRDNAKSDLLRSEKRKWSVDIL
jgi:hypothetical protein